MDATAYFFWGVTLSTVERLHNDFQSWGGLLSRLSELTPSDQSDIDILTALAQSLREFTGGSGHIEPEVLCDQLLECIQKIHSREVQALPPSGKSWRDLCDEMRLRMTSVSIAAIRMSTVNDPSENNLLAQSIESPSIGTITVTPGRTAYARVKDTAIIVLPAISNTQEEQAALAGILEVSERFGLNSHWIIDFSAVHLLSREFCGILVGYAHSLRAADGELTISWLNQGAEINCPIESFIKTLQLVPCGGYWFSRGLVGLPLSNNP